MSFSKIFNINKLCNLLHANNDHTLSFCKFCYIFIRRLKKITSDMYFSVKYLDFRARLSGYNFNRVDSPQAEIPTNYVNHPLARCAEY